MINQRAEERRLWERYKAGDKEAARILYEKMKPLIISQTKGYAHGNIPMVAIEAEAREWFLKALDEYDPSRGAEFSTYLVTRLKRVGRFVGKYKDAARIPKENSEIRLFQDAKSHLEMVLGREPSSQELAEDLKWDMNTISYMEQAIRKDLSTFSLGQKGGGEDLELPDDRRVMDTIWLLYYSLKNDEKVIMEYLLGWGGKPKLKAKEIAKKLGISEAMVSRLRTKISKEFDKYY